MNLPPFRSALAKRMRDFVSFKQTQQYDYTACAQKLRSFDAFLVDIGYNRPWLTLAVFDQYRVAHKDFALHTQRNRLSVAWRFARFLCQFEPRSQLPERPRLPSPGPRYFLFTSQDLRILLQEARGLGPQGSIRPHTYRCLIGLLFTTGVRIAEALALDTDHLFLRHNRLYVEWGKFAKDRWISLAPTTVTVLDRSQDVSLHRPPV